MYHGNDRNAGTKMESMQKRMASVVILISSYLVSPALAVDIHWVGYQGCIANGNPNAAAFLDGSNWLNFLPPGSQDVALFGSGADEIHQNNGFPHIVNFGDFCADDITCQNPDFTSASDVLISMLDIQDSFFTFDMGPGSTIGSNCGVPLINNGSLTIADGAIIGDIITETGLPGNGSLTVSNAVIESGYLILANATGSSGDLTVSGSTAGWTTANGGTSLGLMVGLRGSGNLQIESGAALNTSTVTQIGQESQGSGSIIVTDTGSLFNTELVVVGSGGSGSMTVSNGGDVVSHTPNPGLRISQNAGSTGDVTITGAGSSWTQVVEVFVGGWPFLNTGSAAGTLTISSGGTLSSELGIIGDGNTNAVGSATVTGLDSTWALSSFLTVGDEGQGTLNVADSGNAIVGTDLRVGSAGVINLMGGNITVGTGTPTNVVDVVVVQTNGTLGGTGSINGSVTMMGGMLSPGFSPGTLTINGDYSQDPNSALDIEIGGTTAGIDYDQLIVSGNSSLGGTLNISMINGFVPTPGDSFTILTSGLLNGSFLNVNLNGFPAGLGATLQYSATDARVVITTPGDLNCDGTDDLNDVPGFAMSLSDPSGYALSFPSCNIANADIDSDGNVNGNDIQLFVNMILGM